MTTQEYRRILAERAALDNLLDQLPVSSVIERQGLEFRRKEVEEILASHRPPHREAARVRLTFRGKPAVGSHGLVADFGTAAVKAFADAVTAVGASQNGPLKSRGAVPQRENYRLLITGTALGSFGFELEEIPRADLFCEQTPVEVAVRRTMWILESTIGTDEVLTDAVFDADPRALGALRGFLKTMADQEATCTLEFKDRVFRFSDVHQVRRSESRLRRDYVYEEEQEMSGRFQGVLPVRRTFEFLSEGTGRIVTGKIGFEVQDPGAINDVLGRPVLIKVLSRHAGDARRRYVLLAYKTANRDHKE